MTPCSSSGSRQPLRGGSAQPSCAGAKQKAFDRSDVVLIRQTMASESKKIVAELPAVLFL
eukprot:CAMPEP_0115189018 /NCGR_PEP_ID=MMETSP0270-20121206/11305_1 /TAXON_ID=71861 /ORGANISM="Scrippsiella trochoidea, Strain CCMP3099" /LENGTH=59 /DNA_ID=CAMNT_0002602209 /DNA_START=286 /DNA_END=465 /DNA_ORIENTATION=-